MNKMERKRKHLADKVSQATIPAGTIRYIALLNAGLRQGKIRDQELSIEHWWKVNAGFKAPIDLIQEALVDFRKSLR